jgi:hypothetical protein
MCLGKIEFDALGTASMSKKDFIKAEALLYAT